MLSYEVQTALQAAAAATGNGTKMAVAGIHTVTVQVSGTFVGTITFEGTQDNTNWVALRAYNLTTGVVATTTTGTGIFAISVIGLQHFRARVSAFTSGTITATGRALSPSIPLPFVDLATFAGTPPQLDDTDKLAVSLYGKGTAAGDQALIVESASNPNLRVSLYEGGSQVELVATNADNDSNTRDQLSVAARPQIYNGSTWDKQRGNEELTLFASGARTASANTPDQVNYNHRGAILYLDVTAITDTPSIQLQLQIKDPISSDYHTIFTIGANVTATGNYTYLIYPGALAGAAGNITEAVNIIIPRTWRVRIAHGDSDSITYSLSASMVL